MSKTEVRLETEGTIATITFATEDGLNVGSSPMMRELGGAVAEVARNRSVRATVITGTGKVFLAGADIKEMSRLTPEQAREYGALGQRVLNEIEKLPSITIAGINGAALGGGLELSLACDFRIAVKSAKLGLPETSLGLIPGWGGIPRLTRLIGPARAKKLYLSALPISAEDGLAIGLVDEIYNSAEDVSARIPAFCKAYRRGAPQAVALAKRTFNDGDDLGGFVDCFGTEDQREGISAFIDKRPAKWME